MDASSRGQRGLALRLLRARPDACEWDAKRALRLTIAHVDRLHLTRQRQNRAKPNHATRHAVRPAALTRAERLRIHVAG